MRTHATVTAYLGVTFHSAPDSDLAHTDPACPALAGTPTVDPLTTALTPATATRPLTGLRPCPGCCPSEDHHRARWLSAVRYTLARHVSRISALPARPTQRPLLTPRWLTTTDPARCCRAGSHDLPNFIPGLPDALAADGHAHLTAADPLSGPGAELTHHLLVPVTNVDHPPLSASGPAMRALHLTHPWALATPGGRDAVVAVFRLPRQPALELADALDGHAAEAADLDEATWTVLTAMLATQTPTSHAEWLCRAVDALPLARDVTR